MKIISLAVLALMTLPFICFAETYDATVTTESGNYTVPVEVESGEVTHVYWPNGGAMTVSGAEIEGNYASGTNSRGDSVQIEIEGYEKGASEE